MSVYALCACSLSDDRKVAEQEVQRFHQLLDAGQVDQIYEESADDLKQRAAKKDFLSLTEAVRRKLGATKSSNLGPWNINYHTSGTYLTLNYNTQYERGAATEQFVYRIEKHKPLLAGYYINSLALIAN